MRASLRACNTPSASCAEESLWFAAVAPFDRHDWFVDRGDGVERRYVVDFYFDESRAGQMDAFTVDVRPALDSLASLNERTRMAVRRLLPALRLMFAGEG